MTKLDEATVTWRLFLFILAVCVTLFAIGWVAYDRSDKKPVLDVIGGSFTVDHNTAEIHYNLTVRVTRHLRHGMIIEADFEDPAGHGYYVVRKRIQRWRKRYNLRSPPVFGVRARKRYLVMLRVLNDRGDEELWSDVIYMSSHLGEDVLPQAPVTTWPGRDLTPYQ